MDAVTTHRLWHPFANMAEVDGNELVIDRGEDVWLYDEAGRRYLDGSGSLWYANAGHGREEIAAAVAEQLRKLDAYSTFGEFTNRPALELALETECGASRPTRRYAEPSWSS